MKSTKCRVALGGLLASFAAILILLGSALASGPSEAVIYSFGVSNSTPYAGLVADSAGNLYGTTLWGDSLPNGSVFELSPSGSGWSQTTLFVFDGANGSFPAGPMILDKSGNLYGNTSQGGTGNCSSGSSRVGCGVVFELSPPVSGGTWTETVLYNFQGGNDGQRPYDNLVMDAAGNLYGTTTSGGTGCAPQGCGTVFRLKPPAQKGGAWTETVLHRFNGTDGSGPAGITLKGGALYGAASGGPSNNGLIYKVKMGSELQMGSGTTETVLYNFSGSDGAGPGGVVFGADGNMYGVTGGGGQDNWGTVFELTQTSGGTWAEAVLYDFTGGADGANPNSPVILDEDGNLYGTTYTGGLTTECGWISPEDGCGVVFKVSPSAAGGAWTETVLHSFSDAGSDGNIPINTGVVFGKGGDLYGTTAYGGNGGCVAERGNTVNCGTVYRQMR
jgi:uncharacterized repeat protein (TIGR03803 family)